MTWVYSRWFAVTADTPRSVSAVVIEDDAYPDASHEQSSDDSWISTRVVPGFRDGVDEQWMPEVQTTLAMYVLSAETLLRDPADLAAVVGVACSDPLALGQEYLRLQRRLGSHRLGVSQLEQHLDAFSIRELLATESTEVTALVAEDGPGIVTFPSPDSVESFLDFQEGRSAGRHYDGATLSLFDIQISLFSSDLIATDGTGIAGLPAVIAHVGPLVFHLSPGGRG